MQHDPATSFAAGTDANDMDDEHRTQVRMITAFRDAVRGGEATGAVERRLAELADFTKMHFNSEQMLMRLHAYPHYQAHADEHTNMVDHVEAMRDTYLAGAADESAELADALAGWLVGHIQRTDRALAKYLADIGVWHS